ncbi:hypothetical protein BGZ80_010547 [Entomortierella chlamydospora]|uniref:Uncharacterized protein n=1 Tax=Entomortierella chlamydospora TaxID=101097 RepID=A0A9P6MUS8_9FUNG|nr:hypothetical protein BGZ80_010547 [Entomortierella chlamydospora]
MLRWSSSRTNCHEYFSQNSASQWTLSEFSIRLAESDDGMTALHAINTWREDLGTIIESSWTPKVVKEHCQSLLDRNEDTEFIEHLFSVHAENRVAKSTEEASQATLSAVESTVSTRKRARELAAADVPGKRKQACKEKAKTRSSSSWKNYARKPWSSARYNIFNIARSEDRNKIDPNTLQGLRDMVGKFSLKDEDLEDLEEPLNTFRHLDSLQVLFDILSEMYPKMQVLDYSDSFSLELRYIWTTFDTMYDNGERYVGDEYKMTDIKGKAAALSGIDMRHDAILHHRSLDLDLVVMEAKPTDRQSGRLSDLQKLEKSIAANLQLALTKVPKIQEDKRKHIRSFAILCSGFQISFLEGRLVEDTVLMYCTGKVTLPTTVTISYELAQTLKSVISFKRRVQGMIDVLLQARSVPQDLSSSIGSSGSEGIIV